MAAMPAAERNSQPAVLASGLSIQPRLAGTASGLMGFLQMTVAALGTLLVALLPFQIAVSMITWICAVSALPLSCRHTQNPS